MPRLHERIQDKVSVPIYILALALSRVPSARVYSRHYLSLRIIKFFCLMAHPHLRNFGIRCCSLLICLYSILKIVFIHVVYQHMAILSSLFSIAWSFAIYNRSIRFAREDKEKINWTSSIVQFLWLFLVTCECDFFFC